MLKLSQTWIIHTRGKVEYQIPGDLKLRECLYAVGNGDYFDDLLRIYP